MASLQHNQSGIKDISVATNVPQNDTARLMYYLSTVYQAIEYNDNNIDRYRNYNNWSQLSNEDIRLLVVLCYTLSPDLLDNKVFFHSDALCGNMQNKFYEINQVSHQLPAVQSIVVGGRTRRVNQIMTYQMSWMQTYYFNPIKNLIQGFNNEPQTRPRPRPSPCVIS